jgi:hypothetical protein
LQALTAEINNNVKIITDNSSAMLSQLVDINGNTRRLESMEESMYAVKNSLANIEIRGVKITE